MTRFVNPIEKSALAQALRFLYGPAQIIDGAVYTITIGSISLGLSFEVAKKLSFYRMRSMKPEVKP